MSKLNVDLDYMKIAQYIKAVEYFMEKIKKELDKSIIKDYERDDTTVY